MSNLDNRKKTTDLIFQTFTTLLKLHPSSSSLFCPYPSLTPTKAFRQTHVGCLFYFLLCTYLTIFFIVVLCVSLSFFQHSSPFWCKCVKWQLQYNFTTKSPPSFVSNVFFLQADDLKMTKSALKPVIGTLKKVFYVNQIVSLFLRMTSHRHILVQYLFYRCRKRR